MLDKIRPVNKAKAEKPDPQNVGVELMNALLQLPAAPPKPKGGTGNGKKAIDASDPPAVTDPLTVPFAEPPAPPPSTAAPAAPPAAESPP